MSSQSPAIDILVDAAAKVTVCADATESSFDFMRLPPELRREIWVLALLTDRVLLASVALEVLRPLPAPAIAWVCRESRAVALRYGRHYPLGSAESPSRPRWTWFSPDFDRVLLNFSNDEYSTYLRAPRDAFALDVRHVLVWDTYPYDYRWHFFLLRYTWDAHAQWDSQCLHPAGLALYPNVRSIGVMQGGVPVETGSTWSTIDISKSLNGIGLPRRVRPHDPETTHHKRPAVYSCSESPEGPPGQKSNRHWLPDLVRPYTSKSLWRMLRQWFQLQHDLLPRKITTLYTPMNNSPTTIDWVKQIKRRAPHVYPAELVGFGDWHLRMSAGPRCMNMRGTAYDWVEGEDLLERLVSDPGDVDVDQQQIEEPTMSWPQYTPVAPPLP